MQNILLGVALFAVFLGLGNSLFIKRLKMSYRQHFWFYVPFYLVPLVLTLLLVDGLLPYYQSLVGLALLTVVSLTFLIFEFIWARKVNSEECFGYNQIPPDFKSMLDLSARGAITKVSEILLQQVSALLIFIGLSSLGVSDVLIAIGFALAVFVLHLPSPKWHGKIMGGYFMVTATLLSPLLVYLVTNFETGIYLSTSLHIVMYMVLYSALYLLRAR